MISLFKMEFKRAFISKHFLIVVVLGLLLSMSHLFRFILPVYPVSEKDVDALNTLTQWIGFKTFSFETQMLFFLMPILVAIPYADTYLLEKKNGYLKNVLLKVEKIQYLVVKFITVFVIAGLVISIPLIINLLGTMLFLPSVIPPAPETQQTPLFLTNMWQELYYTHPFLYISSYIGLDFLYAGLFGVIALAVSVFIKNRFLVLITPFILYLLLFLFSELTGKEGFVPFLFLIPAPMLAETHASPIFGGFIILFLLSVITFFIGANKSETY